MTVQTSWLVAIVLIFVGVAYGLVFWQHERLKQILEFLREVKAELKKVTWPNRKEVINTTTVVIVTVFFFGTYLSLVDFIAGSLRMKLFEMLIGS